MNKKQFDKLPKPFQGKIKIDRGVDKLLSKKVVPFIHARKLLNIQKTFRYRCQQFIKLSREGPKNHA